MNTIFKSIKNWIIVILIGIVVIMRILQPAPTDLTEYIKINGKKYELLQQKIDTVWIPQKTIVKTEYVPVPATPIPTPQPIPQDIDTLAILKDYYAKYTYTDEIKMDSIGVVYINDTISQNKIISRSARFEYKLPTITKTTFVKEPPVTKLFIGGSIGFNKPTFINHITGKLILLTKKDRMYGLGIGATTQQFTPTKSGITPFIEGSILWKIKLRRKK